MDPAVGYLVLIYKKTTLLVAECVHLSSEEKNRYFVNQPFSPFRYFVSGFFLSSITVLA